MAANSTTAQPVSSAEVGLLGRALLHVGLLEWAVGLHLVGFSLRLLWAHDPVAARPYLVFVVATLAVLIASTIIYRRFFEGRSVPRLVHQGLVVAAVFLPFFKLQKMIPIIQPEVFDAQLRAIDQWLFGVDASVWLERFATPVSSAWFAASYYGYYVVGGTFIAGMMLFCRRQEELIEFGLMLCGAACVADLMYTVVPAFGPYRHLAHLFTGPLPEDSLVPFVHQVIQNGPLRDVFPSMHTCIPLCIFLFSARYLPWAAVVTGLWLPHIWVSTLFLRYHYLIDVLAGMCLALAVFLIARPAIRAYQRLRRRHGVIAGP